MVTSGRSLRLEICGPGAVTLPVGEVLAIKASVTVDHVESGWVQIQFSSNHVAVLSELEARLEAGSYVRSLEWSIGGMAATPEGGPVVVEVRAQADGLVQAGLVFITVT